MNLYSMIEKLGRENVVGQIFHDPTYDEYLRIDTVPRRNTKRAAYEMKGSFLIPDTARPGLHKEFTPDVIEAHPGTVSRRWEVVGEPLKVLAGMVRTLIDYEEQHGEVWDEVEVPDTEAHPYENTERSIEEELDDNNDTLREAFDGLFTDGVPLRVRMLDEAADLTIGDRNRDYGEPVDNMLDIADIFAAMTGVQLHAHEVPLFHIATKLSRLKNTPGHHDSVVDIMAYAGIYAECVKAQEEAREWAAGLAAEGAE